jgi:hypothetical protein
VTRVLVPGPENVVPRIAEGQTWRFGRRLEVRVDQIVAGGNGDGEDLVYFGPIDGRGRLRFTFRLGALDFVRAVSRYGGRLKTE